MVNSTIPLSNVVADTATPVNQAAQQSMNNALQTEQILKAHYEAMDVREKSRLTSTIAGASQLKSYLDKDDIEGAHEFLQQRKSQLHNRMASGENIDTQETDYALDKLRRGDVDGLKNDVASIIAAGQVYGIIGGLQGAPSNVQEWQYYNQLSPEDQQRYLTMKRSNQVVDLGGTKIVPNQANPAGAPAATFPVGLKPEDQPNNAAAKKEAEARGTAAGEQAATAENTINKMGSLTAAFDNLAVSAQTAPSGIVQDAAATVANKTGMGGDAASAQGDFSVKRAGLENEIRAAFRIVGSGAQTDRDALPIIAMLPEENDSQSVKIAKINAAKEVLRVKVQELAKQRNMPDPFSAQATSQNTATTGQMIRVVKGDEAYMIDPADLAAAQAEGFVQQ